MKHLRAIKILALVLAMMFTLHFFACDNNGDDNNEGNNSPTPPTTLGNQTAFFEEFIESHKIRLFNYKEFTSVESLKEFIKDLDNGENYVVFIPNIKDADFSKFGLNIWCDEENEGNIFYSIDYEYKKIEPYYEITGYTTVFDRDRYNQKDLRFEIGNYISSYSTKSVNLQFYYNEEGEIEPDYEPVDVSLWEYAITKDNYVLNCGRYLCKADEPVGAKELKESVFDKTIPISQQKEQEVPEKFQVKGKGLGELVGASIEANTLEEFKSIVYPLANKFSFSNFVVKEETFNKAMFGINLSIFTSREIVTEELSIPIGVYQRLEYLNEAGDTVFLRIKNIGTPNNILIADDTKTYKYSIEFSKEIKEYGDFETLTDIKKYGYDFIIKNGNGIIIKGSIVAFNVNDINLVEAKEQILNNIILIKGE